MVGGGGAGLLDRCRAIWEVLAEEMMEERSEARPGRDWEGARARAGAGAEAEEAAAAAVGRRGAQE